MPKSEQFSVLVPTYTTILEHVTKHSEVSMKKRYVLPALAIAGATASLFAARAQGGVTVTIACGSVGQELELCKEGTSAWATKTGNKVTVFEGPQLTDDRLGFYQQQLAAQSSDIDVYQIGVLAANLIDLNEFIGADAIKVQNAGNIANNTSDGKLVAMPWFTDGGVLYYRTDLLKKYNVTVPKTWAQLAAAATKIQAGERKTNNKFYGFAFQGKDYEGLTCDALEWINSNGGGTIVDAKGNVTINNKAAAATLDLIASVAKKVSPPAVTTYAEEEARGVWQSGNIAFMRNWPYAYSLGQGADSAIKGKIGIAPLPNDGKNPSVGTLGGWQLGVSKFSKNQKVAADLVAYLTSTAVQKERAVKASYQPTISTLYSDADVLKAVPFFKDIAGRNPVARPSSVTGTKYPAVSTAFSAAVHSVLTGKAKGAAALAKLETALNKIKGAGWSAK
jgi:trehalose/maltose transport system substrate-binding protein